MKKILAALGTLLAVFTFSVSPAFAGGSFTASNVSYNSSTHAFSFDYTGYGGASNPQQIELRYDMGRSTFGYLEDPNSTCNFSSASGTCSGTANVLALDGYTCGSHLFIDVNNRGDEWFSQEVTTFTDAHCSSPTPTPTPTTGAGGGFTVNPTDSGKINQAIGSIPLAATKEIFSIFPVVMPYVLLLSVVGIAFLLTKLYMRFSDNNDLSDDNVQRHAEKGESYVNDHWEQQYND